MNAEPVTIHARSQSTASGQDLNILSRLDIDLQEFGLQRKPGTDLESSTSAQKCTITRVKTNDSFFDGRLHDVLRGGGSQTMKEPNLSSISCNSLSCLSNKRRANLQLPTASSPRTSCSEADLLKVLRNTQPLLTPPPDEPVTSTQSNQFESAFAKANMRSASGSEQPILGQPPSQSVSARRVAGLNFSESLDLPDQSTVSGSSSIIRASRAMVGRLNETLAAQQVQIVSQTLPAQAKDRRAKPTFENVLEIAQLEMNSSPFITITHAVPPVRTMQELPKTPPSTPGARRDANDYFGSHQTIFTHAAVVPIYHDHGPAASPARRSPQFIAAPQSVQISILERYIPPTQPQEVQDFFSPDQRSYLSDRLVELSPRNGSLLLIYPTKTGGRAFARSYIGPIIDPYLRQFVLLNNLTSDAAAALGVMTAVDAMIEYEEMRDKVEQLCEVLTQRASRTSPSAYRVTYQEKTDVVLDRSDWMNWFVEQEQSRLRQNLVEYHHAGGRMPGAAGHSEVTVGMLTRELIDGLRKSATNAGDVGLEVGVFVITNCGL